MEECYVVFVNGSFSAIYKTFEGAELYCEQWKVENMGAETEIQKWRIR